MIVRNEILNISEKYGVDLYIKREDLIHPFISGNKYRKLKYNLKKAKQQGQTTLLTFGGAFSNHIAATAAAGKEFGFKTIGIIRGEELSDKISQNETLSFSRNCGMKFKFVTRSTFRDKTSSEFLKDLENEFGAFYHIPEGGTNDLAVKGCEEILTDLDKSFDFVCCSVGTGGTISGIINSSNNNQKILGFPALKGDFLRKDISKFATKSNWELISDFHFGGYAKINHELVEFINKFKASFDVALDPVYTGKMMFGVYQLIAEGYFQKNSKILAIHTGGLQGIHGMNSLLKRKKMPLIDI